jgi:predicted GNAT family acetyltransferase
MRAVTHAAASTFLDAVRPTLEAHEAEHHLVLGVAESLAAAPAPDADLLAVEIVDERGLALAAIMTGPRPLLIASDRMGEPEAAALLWDELAWARWAPSHVIGAVGQAETIVREWERRSGRAARLVMRQRVYKLTAVEPLPEVTGTLRVATTADLELVSTWIAAFEQEALASVLPQSVRGVAERRIAAGDVFLWCDPEPRTMAGSARPTKRAVAVNAVYTPREWRRQGYATACVAEVSRVLLRRGFELCVLYTDLANPTSNAIYTRIGYQPVRDFLMYELSPS